MRIDGAIAVVTGASSGIGAATAVALAAQGATVIGVARRADRLETTVAACRSHSPDSLAHAADVSIRAECDAVVADAINRFGRVDILVNNAGISPVEDPVHHAVDDVERIMAVNFLGPVYLVGASLPGMIANRRGSIINVTSVSGTVPSPHEPAYGASKAALARWSHGLAVDLYGTGVHVGVLSPGPIATEIWAGNPGDAYPGKLYPPEVIALAVVKMVRRRTVQRTVPRRFGSVGALYPLTGRPMRWGLRRYANR
jgi:NAD(P)-dependent dehydrogenase (short-subunit alcohol dehydrogenase family)